MRSSYLALTLALSTGSLSSASALLPGCGWDDYDPRLASIGGVSGTTSTGGQGGGGQGGAGGQGGTGGDPTTTCGTVTMLGNTFDAETDTQIWGQYAPNFGSITAATGSLTLTVQDRVLSNAQFTTRHHYDLLEGSIAVEVSGAMLTNPAWAEFWLGPDSSNHARFLILNGQLRPSYRLGGSSQDLNSIPYVPADHRWLRIRESAGVLNWEASPDGVDYTVLGWRPASGLFPMDQIKMRLRVSANGAVPATPQNFVIDTLVAEGRGAGAWCPIADLQDDFEDGFRARDWLLAFGSDGAGAIEGGGRLQVQLLPTVNNYQYVSSKNYDLTSGQITLELVRHGGDGATSFLELTQEGQTIAFQVGQVDDMNGGLATKILAMTNIDGDIQTRGEADYNPAKHRFLRVRHDGIGLTWETSADGSTWPAGAADPAQIATVSPTPAGLTVEALDVRVGARVVDMAPTPNQTQFDNLNVLPTE